jgi:dinuclear metal center YbgI/SA1388 family protein
MLTVGTVVEVLEQLVPLELAADWDNVGLLVGDRAAPVQRIMTCLTVTPETTAEALERGVGLIVTHHPILFRPIQRLTTDTPEGKMLLALMGAGVAVYSPHTAFDSAPGGINDILAERMRLTKVTPLRRGPGSSQCKIVVFVPESDLERVSDAVFKAQAGHIGQYRECSFRLAGTGTFFGSDTSHPTVGQKEVREEVAEWRLEVVCPEARVEQVVAALRHAHSYEEPAFDVYPLRPLPATGGEGRIGHLPMEISLDDWGAQVKACLGSGPVQVVGDADRSIATVAIACGAGGELISDAVRAGADVLLTGEVRFHDCLAARAQGLALVLPGHYATERCGVEELARQLGNRLAEAQVWASKTEREPLRVLLTSNAPG